MAHSKPLFCLLVNLVFSFFISGSIKAQHYCNVFDSLALIQLSNDLGLDQLAVQPWDPGQGTAPYQWLGIDTIQSSASEYRISKIKIINQPTISGTLSGALFNSSKLNELDTFVISGIGNIGIADTLCKFTVVFPQLKHFEISWSTLGFNSQFLVYMNHNFPNLRSLDFNNSTFFNKFRFWSLPDLSFVQNLIFTNINVPNDTIFLDSMLLSYTNLNQLHLENINLGAISTNSVQNQNLVLYLDNNNLSNFDDLATILRNMPNLVKLYAPAAMNPTVNDSLDLSLFTNRPNLITLDLSNNNLRGPIPIEIFDNFSNVEYLYLNNNDLGSRLPLPNSNLSAGPLSGFAAYQGLKFLRELDLSNNRLGGKLRIDWIMGQQLTQFAPGGGSMPLEQLIFSNNQFNEVRPKLIDNISVTILGGTLNNRFSAVRQILVDNNNFDFLDLFRLKRLFRMQQISPGFLDHYVPVSASDTLDFLYHPQGNIGIGGVRRRNTGATISIAAGNGLQATEQGSVNFLSNKYRWERRDTANLQGGSSSAPITQFIGQNQQIGGGLSSNIFTNNTAGLAQTEPSYLVGVDSTAANAHILAINSLDSTKHSKWIFRALIENDSFPLLTIKSAFKKVEVGQCLDNSGAPVQCQNMVVQYDPVTLAALSPVQQDSLKNAIREELGAQPIEECLCGDIELWAISDTASAMLNGFGKGTKTSTSKASARPQLLSSDPNYNLLSTSNNTIPDSTLPVSGSGNTTAKTLVAIIDSGVDYEYTALTPYISEGPSSNGNCLPNAVWGYNFVDENINAGDDHGHGTAVAGVVAGLSQHSILPDTGSMQTDIGILPLKYTDKEGNGSLFHAACAMRYAAEYERPIAGGTAKVRVINASWGYYGDPCMLLENQIAYVGNDCGILLVTSAGNDGQIVEGADSLRHWPSNSIWDTTGMLGIDNVISVAGTDQNPDQLNSNSNYGPTHIDIAAPWAEVSTHAGTINNFAPVFGTSFAAPQVARAAALLLDKYPEASYYAVKYALMNGVDKMQSADSMKVVSGGRVNFHKADSIMANISDRTLCDPNISVNITEIDNDRSVFKLYPNPASSHLTIEHHQHAVFDVELTMIAVSGQVVLQQNLNQNNQQIDIEHLAKGLYMIHIVSDKKHYSMKLIKN